MNIINLLRDLRNDTIQAIELYEKVRDDWGDEAVVQLVEFCAELVGIADEGDLESRAIDVARVLTVNDDDNTFSLELEGKDDVAIIARDPGTNEWFELEVDAATEGELTEECVHSMGSCEVCTPSHEQDEPA